MVEHERYPTMIVRANSHPWAWGGVREVVVYRPQDLFERFTKCAKARTVVSYFEFDAFAVDPVKAETCAKDLLHEKEKLWRKRIG